MRPWIRSLFVDDVFTSKPRFLIKNLATCCRPDKFKGLHTFVQHFEFIRSTKGRQNLSSRIRFTTHMIPKKNDLKKKDIREYESSNEYKNLLKVLPDIELIDIERKDD